MASEISEPVGGSLDRAPSLRELCLGGGQGLSAHQTLRPVNETGSAQVRPPPVAVCAGAAFELAFSLAAPFLAAGLIYNLALGAINRAMPQLMVALVGAPAITGMALLILALAAPTILQVWAARLDETVAMPWGMP